MTNTARSTLNGIGKHLATILATVSVALIIGTIREVLEMKAAIARLEVINAIAVDDRYRGTEAAADFGLRDRKLEDHEQRLRDLERRQYGLPG